jgi:hypothetical protein
MKSKDYSVRVFSLVEACVSKAGGKTFLAKKVGVRDATVSAWYHGTIPRGETIAKLEKFLKKRL